MSGRYTGNRSHGEGLVRLGRSRSLTTYEREAAAAVRVLREQHSSVRAFATVLGCEILRPHLSRQAIYDWESGYSGVPAHVLLAGARVTAVGLDDLLQAARRRCLRSDEVPVAEPALSVSAIGKSHT